MHLCDLRDEVQYNHYSNQRVIITQLDIHCCICTYLCSTYQVGV